MQSLSQMLQTALQYVEAHPLVLTIGILFVLNIILFGMVIRLSRRISKLLRGNNVHTLEDTIVDLVHVVNDIDNWRETANQLFEETDRRLQKSIRGTALIRFNPFKGTGDGGNQSFSTAFVTEEGDGVVLFWSLLSVSSNN